MEDADRTLLNNEQNYRQREKGGFWSFIKHRPLLVFIGFSGVAIIASVVIFTLWLCAQTMTCPSWALNCTVRPSVAWINVQLPLVQGTVSTAYGIGLALLAYSSFVFAEAAIWPILFHEPYTLKSVDLYLSASRGSIPSLIQAMFSIGTGRALIVMLWVAIVAALLQLDRIAVGQAYTMSKVPVSYQSTYWSGGGIGFGFGQSNPPAPIPAPITNAASFYTSWSWGLSEEPMPEIRDFVVNRGNMSRLGNFSITGVKVVKDVSCTGRAVSILDVSYWPPFFTVDSNYTSPIKLRRQPRMTVWVDGIKYMNSTRTISTLAFAAINGTIEGGTWTKTPKSLESAGLVGISAVQCAVDVTLIETQMDVGVGGPENAAANVSAFSTITGPTPSPDLDRSEYGLLGDVAAWLGVVVTTLGDNIYGAQPLFENEGNGTLPRTFTSITTDTSVQQWTQDDLKNFISVGLGALAMSMSMSDNHYNETITSSLYQNKLVPSRGYMLLIPAGVIVLANFALALSLVRLYQKTKIKEMRQASMSEVICSASNQSIWDGVRDMHGSGERCSRLESMRVNYGTVEEERHTSKGLLWILGARKQPSAEGIGLSKGSL